MQGVVAGVTQQYVTQVRDQLQAMRTAELSLQKVRKSRAQETAQDGAKPLSDVDKVNAQLLLDVQVSTHAYTPSADMCCCVLGVAPKRELASVKQT